MGSGDSPAAEMPSMPYMCRLHRLTATLTRIAMAILAPSEHRSRFREDRGSSCGMRFFGEANEIFQIPTSSFESLKKVTLAAEGRYYGGRLVEQNKLRSNTSERARHSGEDDPRNELPVAITKGSKNVHSRSVISPRTTTASLPRSKSFTHRKAQRVSHAQKMLQRNFADAVTIYETYN